ncbi:MAG: DUF3795 domain-containing protein [Desulfobacterales bacterium]|nr:MAG: DUF3795 domain-containing protein [Desulfobacterales bacterium]
MKEMTAFCGLACHECDTYQATKNDDDKKRVKVANLWSKQYNMNLERQDINCDGCRSGNDRLFAYCKSCVVRKCGMERDVDNCAHCSDYPCEKLNPIFMAAPGLKERLDSLKMEFKASIATLS